MAASQRCRPPLRARGRAGRLAIRLIREALVVARLDGLSPSSCRLRLPLAEVCPLRIPPVGQQRPVAAGPGALPSDGLREAILRAAPLALPAGAVVSAQRPPRLSRPCDITNES